MSETASACALVVDDDALIRMDAVDILENAGFEVMDAPDVKQALDVLALHHARLNLLFTDVQMHGLHDGFHLAREVARCWPHISILVASGHAAPAFGDLPDGARFINKPFSAHIVHEHLRETLPLHRMPKALDGR